MDFTKPHSITVLDKRKVEYLTQKYLSAAQHLKPTQRKGLESLVAWTNRFKGDMGEFIKTQTKNIMDPTPAIMAGAQDDTNEDWENRLIETACKIEGRYGQLTQLLQMSKQFLVNETSDLKLTTNRDTGEAEMKFINEPDSQHQPNPEK